MSSLDKYRKSIFSQNGEEGILIELLERLGIQGGWVCEFGAWDGKYLSNTFYLVRLGGWRAVYIESDDEKFNSLLETAKEHDSDKIIPIHAKVLPQTIDQILATTLIPKDFEVLSSDVDGNDYQIWEGLKNYSPKILIIEINSYIRPGSMASPYPGTKGIGFTDMLTLGRIKGYTPVAHTGNIFFVRSSLFDKVGLPQEEVDNPDLLFDYSYITTLEREISEGRKL